MYYPLIPLVFPLYDLPFPKSMSKATSLPPQPNKTIKPNHKKKKVAKLNVSCGALAAH